MQEGKRGGLCDCKIGLCAASPAHLSPPSLRSHIRPHWSAFCSSNMPCPFPNSQNFAIISHHLECSFPSSNVTISQRLSLTTFSKIVFHSFTPSVTSFSRMPLYGLTMRKIPVRETGLCPCTTSVQFRASQTTCGEGPGF